MKKFIILNLLFFLFVSCNSKVQTKEDDNSNSTQTIIQTKESDSMTVAIIKTNMGIIELELFADLVPKTVENFVGLAKKGYYDGVIFHRVIDKFMIQGGDPTGTGRGGESFLGGKFSDEFVTTLRHDSAGILSMANAGPNTNGSQFFITLAPTPWLDGKHTIFGKVINGMDVVSAIGKVAKGPNDRPLKDVVMEKVEIEKRQRAEVNPK